MWMYIFPLNMDLAITLKVGIYRMDHKSVNFIKISKGFNWLLPTPCIPNCTAQYPKNTDIHSYLCGSPRPYGREIALKELVSVYQKRDSDSEVVLFSSVQFHFLVCSSVLIKSLSKTNWSFPCLFCLFLYQYMTSP